ncbi:MAG: YafY family protein, partial [Balneolaceae bacterium]
MNRIDRLTAIIIYLQGRNGVTVEELSRQYDISVRTVYRDLSALQETGVPIGSEPGKGYFIVKGYHLPPVMFNRSEASSLLAAERLMQRWSKSELSRSYLSALDKIRAVLPSRDKEFFDTLDRHIKTYSYKKDKEQLPDDRIFTGLQNVIFRKEIIEIDYYSPYKRQKTTRKVEPLGLLLMGDHWYLAGWCRLRNDYRMFRLDRFKTYRSTGNFLPDPPEHTLQEFYERNLHEEEDLQEVVVWFEQKMVRYVGDQKYRYGWAWEKDVEDGVEMTFLTSYAEYFSRWLLIWGSSVRVVKSDTVKERVKELAEELY